MKKAKIISILLMAAIVLTGCSKNENDTVSKSIDTLLSGKSSENIRFVTEKGNYIDNVAETEISQMIISKIDYNVLNVSTDEGNTKSEIQFNYPDMVAIISEYVSENTESTFDEWFLKQYTNDCPMLQKTISVELIEEDGKLGLEINEELSNILTGGLLEYKFSVESNSYRNFVEE